MRRITGIFSTLAILLLHLPGLIFLAIFKRTALPNFVGRLLIRLGPVYIKFAQVISTRKDVLPKHWLDALAQLRENVPPENPARIRKLLDQHWPNGLTEVFQSFEDEPIAAGSVAQVHRATLKEGTPVAVKILRPGIRQRIENNFSLIFFLVRIASFFSKNIRAANVIGMVSELHQLLLSQTDLRVEGENFKRFSETFREDRHVLIPEVFMEISGKDILVTEFVDAIHPDDYAQLDEDSKVLARRLDGLLDNMVFIKGLFHADLHPGNFFWNSDAKVVLIDLGLVHDIPQIDRNHIVTFYYAIVDGYYEFATEYFLNWLATPRGDGQNSEANRKAAFDAAYKVIDDQYRLTNGHPQFADMFNQLLSVLGKHQLELRSGYTNIFLTLITVEGYLYALDPNFDMIENARRKRIEDNEYTSVPEDAVKLVLGKSGTYSTAYFNDTDDIERAYELRDNLILEHCLNAEPGKRLMDIGCGRGNLLLRAKNMGLDTLGITISPYEQQVCTEKGLTVVHSSWEDFEENHGDQHPPLDYVTIVEVLSHLGSLHENKVGLVGIRLKRLMDWLKIRVKPNGIVYLQELTIDPDFLHKPENDAAYQRLTEDLPWVGFTMVEQIKDAAQGQFEMEKCLDHSSDLVPTYDFFLSQIDTHYDTLTNIMRTDMLDMVRKEIVAYRDYSREGVLKLHRMTLRSI